MAIKGFVSVLGIGQTWQNVTASRALGTTYTNSTGKPLMVCAVCSSGASASAVTVTNGGITSAAISTSESGYTQYNNNPRMISIIVKSGDSYSIQSGGGSPNIQSWHELR